ncbi:hypothetical protein D3C76_1634880 [compost metagenome]
MCADKPPAIPANNAPIVNAMTLYKVVLIPMASAAISFSRIARQARPCVERIKLLMSTMVNSVKKKIIVQVDLAGMPLSPEAPPTYSVFSKTMRIISPKPSVAIAK